MHSFVLLFFLYTIALFSSEENDDKKHLILCVNGNFECPWYAQYGHKELECGNCKSRDEGIVTEKFSFKNDNNMDNNDIELIITKKSNFEMTGFVTPLFQYMIETGIKKLTKEEEKKRFITACINNFQSLKKYWLSFYRDRLLESSSHPLFLECASKKSCSIKLYKKNIKYNQLSLPIIKKITNKPIIFEEIVIASKGEIVIGAHYCIEVITEFFNIFALTCLPSENQKTFFNPQAKWYLMNHMIDYLEKLK